MKRYKQLVIGLLIVLCIPSTSVAKYSLGVPHLKSCCIYDDTLNYNIDHTKYYNYDLSRNIYFGLRFTENSKFIYELKYFQEHTIAESKIYSNINNYFSFQLQYKIKYRLAFSETILNTPDKIVYTFLIIRF